MNGRAAKTSRTLASICLSELQKFSLQVSQVISFTAVLLHTNGTFLSELTHFFTTFLSLLESEKNPWSVQISSKRFISDTLIDVGQTGSFLSACIHRTSFFLQSVAREVLAFLTLQGQT